MDERAREAGHAVVKSATREALVACLVYACATAYFTWPALSLVADHLPSSKDMHLADLYAVTWILTSVARALLSDPLNLFEGNAFHPFEQIIAQSEHMVGSQIIFAPILQISGNPVLALNALGLLSFVFTGLSMHWLIWHWTQSRGAAYVAGLAFAFSIWRLVPILPHLLQVQYFPIVVLLLDRVLRTGRIRVGVALGLVLGLQILCSYYLGYMVVAIAATYVIANADRLWGRASVWVSLSVAAIVCLAAIAPVTLPYIQKSRAGVLPILPIAEFVMQQPILGLKRMVANYIGWGTLVWGVVGGIAGVLFWQRDRVFAGRALGLLFIAWMGVALAQGPQGFFDGWISPYGWFNQIVPGFDRMRWPPRFLAVASFALCALCGFTVATLAKLPGDRLRSWIQAAVISVALALTLAPAANRVPLRWTRVPSSAEVSGAYAWLASRGERGPLLELPIATVVGWVDRHLGAARAMFMSTRHRMPLVNGYTSYPPPAYTLIENFAEQLPGDLLPVVVACTGTEWILLHSAAGQRRGGWDMPGVVRQKRFLDQGVSIRTRVMPDFLYQIDLPFDPECPKRLVDLEGTLDGNLARVVDPIQADFDFLGLEDEVFAGRESRVTVKVRNRGRERLPGPAVNPALRVMLSVRWRHEDDEREPREAQRFYLPHDVEPEQEISFQGWLRHPHPVGAYELEVRLAQGESEQSHALEWTRQINVSRFEIPKLGPKHRPARRLRRGAAERDRGPSSE